MAPKKMKMQGTAQHRRRAVVKWEAWNVEEQEKMEEETMLLKDILCPACGTSQKTRDMKLRVKTGFSSAKCKNTDCGNVAVSSAWICRCRKPWITCPAHVHEYVQVK